MIELFIIATNRLRTILGGMWFSQSNSALETIAGKWSFKLTILFATACTVKTMLNTEP